MAHRPRHRWTLSASNMTYLELLAPARNAEIGIAAIDCGADAVYMAGPSFGARQDASNEVAEVARVCAHAARYGARVFVTLNTILYDSELDRAEELMRSLEKAGVSAFIVQDLALVRLAAKAGIKVPLHASTQCAIRTPEAARMYSSLGFSRLVLERQLSLEDIRAVRAATDAELEFFVHGALCVCYSGQCYLSEHLAGRSANRGACTQACRSRYDLEDAEGNTLVRNKALLSLKDYNLSDRLEDLAEAGVCSFKIEGRLKNISYVRNVTRSYSLGLDRLVSEHPERYCRASYGNVVRGFNPDLSKTFNRGYTELFLDGRRGRWAAMDIATGRGEEVGMVVNVKPGRRGLELLVRTLPGVRLANGDGFTFSSGGEVTGFRAELCEGNTVICKEVQGIRPGVTLYRNVSAAFERELQAGTCSRDIPAEVSLAFSRDASGNHTVVAEALTADGRKVSVRQECGGVTADNQDRMRSMAEVQMGRKTGDYEFTLVKLVGRPLPLLSAASLNAIRRALAEELDRTQCLCTPLKGPGCEDCSSSLLSGRHIDYRGNVSNALSRQVCLDHGAAQVDEAYELSHAGGAELMRTKYCIRYELGMCLMHSDTRNRSELFLVNNGRRLALGFDCRNCEMTVREASGLPHNHRR